MRVFGLLIMAFLLNGCVAKLAADVVTAPIKIASKTVDVLTTSQEESDRNRGRAARKQEEEEAKARRKEEKRERKHQKELDDY